MTNNLRPDELATQSEIKKSMGRTNDIRSGLEAISSFGGATLGAKAASKILPFINQYIPKDLALKGINKVMPSLGKFLQNGVSQGLSLQSGLDFLKDEFSKESTKKENPKEQNIISQHSQELYQALKDKIGQGIQPLAAAYQFANDSKYKKDVTDIQKKTGKSFSDLVSAVFGGDANEQAAPQAQQTKGKGAENIADAFSQMGSGMMNDFYNKAYEALRTGKNTMAGVKDPVLSKAKPLFDKGLIKSPEDLKKYANNNYQEQNQQAGPGNQALTAMIQKINQKLGG